MVALLWQQRDARGTLNLPAATKVEDLKLCLNRERLRRGDV